MDESHLAPVEILLLSVDLGCPQGAPLQVNCVGVPLVGTLKIAAFTSLDI
jgi:hypothetical protein